MKTTMKQIKVVAQTLRYCGYSARADYQLMHVVIRDEIPYIEYQAIQKMNENVCIIAPNAK